MHSCGSDMFRSVAIRMAIKTGTSICGDDFTQVICFDCRNFDVVHWVHWMNVVITGNISNLLYAANLNM